MSRGRPSRSAGNGKLIDTIHYDYEQDAGGKIVSGKVEIKIFLQKRYGDSEATPLPVTAVQFMAVSGTEVEYGTDLNAVVKAMRSKLDALYRITWERWLEVRVEPSRVFRGIGAGLELSWTDVDRGVTLEGDVLLRRFNSKHSPGAVWLLVGMIVYRVFLWTHTRTPPAFKFYQSLILGGVAAGQMTRRSGSLRKALSMA